MEGEFDLKIAANWDDRNRMSKRLFSITLVVLVAAAIVNAAPSSAWDPLPFQQHWDIIDSSGFLDTE